MGPSSKLVLSCACLAYSVGVILREPEQDDIAIKPASHQELRKFRQTMRNYKDSQYYGQVKVGDQLLDGVLDTGSTELVVLSDKCKSECGRDNRDLYHAAKSTAYQHGKLALDISYGSGELNGREAYDSVSIGPFSSKDVPFWEVTHANMPILASSEFQAIVGLGPIPPHVKLMSPGSPRNNESYALVLRKLDLLRYSICLSKAPGGAGYLTWMDDNQINNPGLFRELKVIDQTYWMAKLTDVKLGDMPFTLCRGGCGAIIDSGTSLLAVPKKTFKKLAPIIGKLGDESGCDVSSLPDIHFKLDGKHFSMPPDSYIGVVTGDVPSALVQNFEVKMNASCQAALMAMDLPSTVGDTWVLGVPFLRNYLTIFEQGPKPTIHTAQANTDCQVATGKELMLHGERRTARTIDASSLHLPQWLHRAKDLGSLDMRMKGKRVARSASA